MPISAVYAGYNRELMNLTIRGFRLFAGNFLFADSTQKSEPCNADTQFFMIFYDENLNQFLLELYGTNDFKAKIKAAWAYPGNFIASNLNAQTGRTAVSIWNRNTVISFKRDLRLNSAIMLFSKTSCDSHRTVPLQSYSLSKTVVFLKKQSKRMEQKTESEPAESVIPAANTHTLFQTSSYLIQMTLHDMPQ